MILLGLAWFFWPSGSQTKGHGNIEQAAGKDGEGVALAAGSDQNDVGVNVLTPTPRPTLEAELLSDVVGSGAKVKNLVVPRTLEIKGVGFVIQPINIKVGDWLPPDVDRAVTWVNGTVINYVMGMNATSENKELLASLIAGDQFLLRMSTGQAYRFVYADTIRVAPQASEVYGQNRPSLTLVLLGSNEETRIVIRALYVPDADLISLTDTSSPVKPIRPNQRVVLDDRVAVTFLGNEVIPAPDTLRGYAYMGVNCIIEYLDHTTTGPLLTSSFIHHIEFEGLTHPMVAVNKTRYPVLPENLQPHTPVTVTLVYAIPESNLRQEMLWGFIANPAMGTTAQAILPPYEGPLAPVVEVLDYVMEDKGITLTLKITAALHDVELATSGLQIQGGMLSPTGNHFPWRIPFGEARAFQLILNPDKSQKLTVILLDQGIELSY